MCNDYQLIYFTTCFAVSLLVLLYSFKIYIYTNSAALFFMSNIRSLIAKQCVLGEMYVFLVRMSDWDTRKILKSLAGKELMLKDMSYFRQLLRNIGITRKNKRFSRINLLWEIF